MSSKMNKSVSSDAKSRTKALLMMLEKLMTGGNPDKEQTRFLCHKLLHLVSSHDAAKKEISSKVGLETVLTVMETCGDQVTCLTLVNTLSEVAAGNGVKRLVSHDVTRVLLHTVAYLGKEGDNRLLIALLNLSVKIAPKDRRFALRVRLASALPVLVSIVRSNGTSSKLLSSTMQCLKICSSNGVNARILGRIGAVHVLQRLVGSLGRRNPILMKTVLATLSLLIKSSRSNVSHAISNSLMPQILALHQDWHKHDLKNHRHIPARKSMLNIMKHMTSLRRGRKAFNDAGGLRILYRTLKECTESPSAKAADSLLVVGTLIIRRCQPRFRLPIPTVQCSFKFQLPESGNDTNVGKVEEKICVDDVIDESDDDEDEEDDSSDPIDVQDGKNPGSVKQENASDPPMQVPLFIPPLGTTIPLKRSSVELSSMYEQFFPEYIEYQLSEDNSSSKSTNQKTSHRTTSPPITNGQVASKKQKFRDGLSRAHSENILACTERPVQAFRPLTTGPNSALQDTFLDDSIIHKKYHTEGESGEKCETHRASRVHSALMESLAASTKSQKQQVNTVSLADSLGHLSLPHSEHQVVKKYGVQRVKMLEDVGRTMGAGDIINKIIYSRDGDYQPPVSGDYASYKVALSKSLSTEFEPTACVDCDDHGSNQVTPIIESHPEITALFQDQYKLPIVSCGCKDTIDIPTSCDEIEHTPRKPLRFRSDFECGNLRTAIQVREHEYDLILDSDCNSNHHHQWFYFEVSNITARVPYRFNIVNCEKSNSQFNYGMQPLMYSVTEARIGRPCWRRAGYNLCYYKSHFSRSAASAGGVKGRSYYTMTFTLTFHHDGDICYFSYHYPYTYTQLQSDIHELVGHIDQNEVYVKVQTLCHTLGGNPVPVLTITAPPHLNGGDSDQEAIREFRSRPYVFLSARVHPGESNSSWTMRGSLKFLLATRNSENTDAKTADMAESLRRTYIFKVVPMLNPDGVINGHHRSSLTGDDLNRQWTDPDQKLYPTIFHTKGLLQYLYSIGKAPLVYCDYHGHSRRKNVFVYGCSRKESVIAGESDAILGAPDDYGHKALPKLLQQLAPAFSLSNCSFVVEKCKESTARVVVWKEIGVARSYTMESTYCGCDQGKYKGLQIGTRELEEMGMKFCEALLHLKAKDRARRLPLSDIPLSEFDKYSDSTSDIPSADFNSLDPLDVGRLVGVSEHSTNGVRYSANSDEELTPEDVGSVASFDAPSEEFQDLEARFSDEALIDGYPREFWDYNEFCRGFGFESDDDNSDVDNDHVTSSGYVESGPPQFSMTGDHVMTTYRICPDTGRVLSPGQDTGQLADKMAGTSILDPSHLDCARNSGDQSNA